MAQANSQSTCCAAAPKLIFSCSGAADVGEISDRAARKLSAEGAGKMFCLAGVGGRVSGIVASTQAAAAILAIDGCPLDCARKTLALSNSPISDSMTSGWKKVSRRPSRNGLPWS